MGNFEKLVVLIVLFLSAVVLAVSLRADGDIEETGPYDAAQARLQEGQEAPQTGAVPGSEVDEPGPAAVAGAPLFESSGAAEETEPADYLLDAEIPPVEPNARGQETVAGPPRILRTTRGLHQSALADFMVYTVAVGDTWESLAERFYRDARHIEALRLANEDLEVLVAEAPILVPVYDLTVEVTGPRGPGQPEGQPEVGVVEAGAAVLLEATSYVVLADDSLSGISLKVYGTAKRWKQIFEANRDRLESPDWLQVGTKIRIPRGAELEALEVRREAAGDRPRVR